jgi:lipopolysaccharide export system protein LptA
MASKIKMHNNNSDKHGFRGLHWALMFVMALVVASMWAQSPKKGAGLKRDTSPIRPTIPTANRNQTGKVFLERADLLMKGAREDYQIVTGNVEFRRGGMFMYCDSAHFYDNPGAIEAYGNVRMRQGDTLFVYADELTYADTTQMAVLYAYTGKKVKLINRDVTLTTDLFNYDLGIDLGYYEFGGVLTDPKNKLTSWYGEYSPSSKDALFRDNVVLHSLRDRDTLDIFSEQMLYNTNTHVAVLDTTSTIVSKDGTIYTHDGTYNTDTQQADLFSRSKVVAKNGNTLIGDTLYYNQQTGFGEAFGNIEMVDTTHKVILNGEYGFYYEDLDSARVYGRALAREYSRKDTLYLHGDTITTYRRIILPQTPASAEDEDAPAKLAPAAPADSLPLLITPSDSLPALADSLPIPTDSLPMLNDSLPALSMPTEGLPAPPDSLPASPATTAPPADTTASSADSNESSPDSRPALAPVDSVAAPADTIHYLVASPNVKFYRVDLQGLCDSMTFVSKDSLLYLDRHPVVWNEERQIFGNRMIIHMNDSTVDWAHLPEFGFTAEHIDEEFYNQLTGKDMYALFQDGELHHLDVSGNVQVIMLPQENDSTYNKIANIESSYMAVDFTGKNMDRMKLWSETSGTMTPLYLAKKQLFYLPQFRWFEPLRPLKPEDVFDIQQEMLDLFNEPPFGSSRRQ